MDSLLDSLNCPICLELCLEPVESSCCANLYCKKCSDELKECSLCRKKCRFVSSILAKRMISNLPANCSYCNYRCSKGDLSDHQEKCDKKTIDCPIFPCAVKIAKIEFFEHLYKTHHEEINKKIQLILDLLKSNVNERKFNVASITTVADDDNIRYNQREICIEAKRNEKGDLARLGSTGKYFCGERLKGNCVCCNGFCGPTNGCNCESCMKLDILSRNLSIGWLVNKEGFNSKRATNGLFYCGRYVMEGVPFCDGYCGPNDGPNCKVCQILDNATRYGGRYANLL